MMIIIIMMAIYEMDKTNLLVSSI